MLLLVVVLLLGRCCCRGCVGEGVGGGISASAGRGLALKHNKTIQESPRRLALLEGDEVRVVSGWRRRSPDGVSNQGPPKQERHDYKAHNKVKRL